MTLLHSQKRRHKINAITRLLILNGIYLICLSVRKWLTDTTTFTQIFGYGDHPPLSDYLVVRKVKLQCKIQISLNETFLPENDSISYNSFGKKHERDMLIILGYSLTILTKSITYIFASCDQHCVYC